MTASFEGSETNHGDGGFGGGKRGRISGAGDGGLRGKERGELGFVEAQLGRLYGGGKR